MTNEPTLIPDNPATANTNAVSYPLEVELTLKLKMLANNPGEREYLTNSETHQISSYFIADVFDALDTNFEDVLSINGLTRTEIQKLLHEAEGATT